MQPTEATSRAGEGGCRTANLDRADSHENERGFGEDCLSVQGLGAQRPVARVREFRSRRDFLGFEGTAARFQVLRRRLRRWP